MKNCKNIACTDFVNASIALNLHLYEKKLSLHTRFHKKSFIFCFSLNHKIWDTYL